MLATTYAITSSSNPLSLGSTDASQTPLSSATVTPKQQETVLSNGVTIFGSTNSLDVQELSKTVNEFPKLWKDTGTFADIPEDEWMKIPLRGDWESRIPTKGARVYPLGTEDRKEVDKTFDQLHELRKMS